MPTDEMPAQNLYLVCQSIQPDIITKHCFEQCKKIIVGAIELSELMWLPCRSKDCPYLEKEVDMGVGDVGFGKENIVIRKLKNEIL